MEGKVEKLQAALVLQGRKRRDVPFAGTRDSPAMRVKHSLDCPRGEKINHRCSPRFRAAWQGSRDFSTTPGRSCPSVLHTQKHTYTWKQSTA